MKSPSQLLTGFRILPPEVVIKAVSCSCQGEDQYQQRKFFSGKLELHDDKLSPEICHLLRGRSHTMRLAHVGQAVHDDTFLSFFAWTPDLKEQGSGAGASRQPLSREASPSGVQSIPLVFETWARLSRGTTFVFRVLPAEPGSVTHRRFACSSDHLKGV